jgi:hypothetical protein
MNYTVCTAGAVAGSLAGTYDYGGSVAQVKAIDQAMRNYYRPEAESLWCVVLRGAGQRDARGAVL